ncbi:MAG: DUF624 domain-containing protein [Eubacterium sp.]|nr:DUF624 domain-containing protein [Eubacterium sp.]
MNLMNEDNIVSICLNTIGDIVVLNLLFVICSLPIVTIGPSLCALYHCMLRITKGTNNGVMKTFFRALRENFVQSLLVWIGVLAAGAVVFVNIRFLLYMPKSAFSTVLLYLSYAVAVLGVILFLYVFPVMAALAGTIKDHLRNSVLFAFMHFPSTMLIALISLLPMYMTYQDLELLPLYTFCWASFGFGLTSYINSMLFYRMFRPYLKQDTEQAV